MENVNGMENVDLKAATWKMNSFGKCKSNGKCRFKSHVENEFVWKM